MRTYINRILKTSLFEIFSGLYVAHQLLPVFGAIMPSIVYAILFLITFVLTIPRIGLRSIKSILPIFLISFITMLQYILLFDISSMIVFFYGEMQILLFGLIAAAYINDSDTFKIKRFASWVFICYFITTITTFIGCTVYPTAARVLATINETNLEECRTYLLCNIGGFSFVYELVSITPIMLYCIKEKLVNRVFGVLVVCLIGATIIKTQYTTALMLYILFFVVLFFDKYKKLRFLFLMFVLTSSTFIKPLIISFLSWFSGVYNSDLVSSRIMDIVNILKGSQLDEYGSAASRIELYQQSWDAFCSSSYWGTWDVSAVGAHSFVFDTLGQYGVIGIIGLIIFFATIWRFSIKPYRRTRIYSYLVWIYVFSAFMTFMNPKSNTFVFIFIIPLFAKYACLCKDNVIFRRENCEIAMDSK